MHSQSGRYTDKITMNMMSHLMGNKLSSRYNWKGLSRTDLAKEAFCKLTLLGVIKGNFISILCMHTCTEVGELPAPQLAVLHAPVHVWGWWSYGGLLVSWHIKVCWGVLGRKGFCQSKGRGVEIDANWQYSDSSIFKGIFCQLPPPPQRAAARWCYVECTLTGHIRNN